MPGSLPLLGEARPERADAAENRRKVLAAAEALFARCGPANVTMDAVAAEAGVGKGTLFRRFGDRAGLARAVISEHETELQDATDPRRAAARPGRAAARAPDRLRPRVPRPSSTATPSCCCAAEGSHDAHLASGPYAFYRTHVALLLREAGLRRARRLPRRRRARPAERHRRSRTTAALRQLSTASELAGRSRGPLRAAS